MTGPVQMEGDIKPCATCSSKGKVEYDYVRGTSYKHHHVVCTENRYHLSGVGCYNVAPGKNASHKCDFCHTNDVPCQRAIGAWNGRM